MLYLIEKKTKVVCTIGPASQDKEVMRELIRNGMTCMRLNFSHGDHLEHLQKIQTLRDICDEEGIIIPICLDTKGPEIRTSCFKGGQASFEKGKKCRISMDDSNIGSEEKFGVTYSNLFYDAPLNSILKLDDGNLELKVIEKDEEKSELVCEILNSHVCKDRRGVNCPGAHLNMPYISEVDKKDLIFACQNHFDIVFASFVRNLQDIQDIRNLLNSHGGKNIMVVSKIENTESIENLDEIIRASDGIMVARGDLGIEIPAEDVPIYQRYIIKECRKYGKPVITATQMLDSMVRNPIPTRAEVSDVAWAIDEGSDAVMLSGESASGLYPVEAVKMQTRIAQVIESHFDYVNSSREAFASSNKSVSDAIAMSVSETASIVNAKLIVCFSISGNTAIRISKTRPVCPTFVVSSDLDALSKTMFYYGNYPYLVSKVPQFTEEMEVLAIKIAVDYNIKPGSKIIITGGTPVGAGKTNFLKVITYYGNNRINVLDGDE